MHHQKRNKSIAHWTLLVEGNNDKNVNMLICCIPFAYLFDSVIKAVYIFHNRSKTRFWGNSWVLGLTLTLHVVGPYASKFNVILHILILVCRITLFKTLLYWWCVFLVWVIANSSLCKWNLSLWIMLWRNIENTLQK